LFFVMDPGGHKMGVTTELLISSPFTTFLIPGLFLLIINGFGNLAGGIITFMKKKAAGPLAIILAWILMLWIILQVYWIGYISFLQPLMFSIGLIEAISGYLLYIAVKSRRKKHKRPAA